MAIYHVRLEKGGGYSVQGEMRNGREKLFTQRWHAKDKEALRRQTQNLATLVKAARKGGVQFRGAQDSLEGVV